MSPPPVEVVFTDALINVKSVYHSGQTLPLVVRVRLTQPSDCTIYAKIYGECCVSWLEGFLGFRQVSYKATEVHLNDRVAVYDSQKLHPPGQQLYPVKFSLPEEAPSSFLGEHGFIRYFVIACIERGSRSVYFSQKYFTVVHAVDLNSLPPELIGQYFVEETLKVKCCFCCGCCCGQVLLRLRLPRRGYVLGDLVDIAGEIQNDSTADLEGVCLQITQQSTYFVQRKCKLVSHAAASIELPPVRSGKSIWLNHQLPIVGTLPTFFVEGCQNIKVHHFLQLVGYGGCSWLLRKQLCEIIIGTAAVRSL